MKWSLDSLSKVGVELNDETLTKLRVAPGEDVGSKVVSKLIAVGAWIGSFFLLGFLGLLFGEAFDLKGTGLSIVSLFVIAGAIAIHLQSRDVFSEHFALSLSIGGHLGFYGGIGWLADSMLAPACISVPMSGITYFFYRKEEHRFLSVFSSTAMLLVALRIENLMWWIPAVTSVHVGVGCLGVTRFWHREALRPLFMALLMAPLIAVVTVHQGWGFRAQIDEYFAQMLTAPLALAWLGTMWWMTKGKLSTLLKLGIIGMATGLAFLGSAGIVASLILMVVGRLRSYWLIWYGTGCLAISIIETYYNMDRTLLYKSLSMLGVSVVMGGLAFLFWLEQNKENGDNSSVVLPNKRKTWIAPLVGLLWIMGGLSFCIVQKEETLQNGKVLLLELAPRDPRSIMQGDYMVLRYELVQNLPEAPDQDGKMVLSLDQNGVGRFRRWDDGTAINDGEVFLRFRKRKRAIRLGAESFFFEEGKAKLYESAKYSRLMVGPDGESILVDLHGENFKAIRPDDETAVEKEVAL